jgi:hypothetical protein
MNIYNIEKTAFVIYLVSSYYVMYYNPANLIPFNIYVALFYLPINIMVIRQKKKDNIEINDFEMAHRIFFMSFGLIPIVGLFSEPVKKILQFKEV